MFKRIILPAFMLFFIACAIAYASLPLWLPLTGLSLINIEKVSNHQVMCDINKNESAYNCVVPAKACTQNGNCLNDEVLLFRGVIGLPPETEPFQEYSYVESLFQDYTINKGDVLCFDSVGGFGLMTKELYKFTRRKGLRTCMAETYIILNEGSEESLTVDNPECSSNCVTALLFGSDDRISVGSNPKIMIHRHFDIRVNYDQQWLSQCGWIPYFPVWPYADYRFVNKNNCVQDELFLQFKRDTIGYKEIRNPWESIVTLVKQTDIDEELWLTPSHKGKTGLFTESFN